MPIIFRPVPRGDGGFALTITLVFLAISLMIFGSVMFWISSNAKVTIRNNQYNMSSGAAEAAVETVLSQMDRDFLNQSLTNAGYYAALSVPMTNWPAQYVFSGTNDMTNQVSVWLNPTSVYTNLNSQFTGLYGLEQDCTIIARAAPTVQSGVTDANVPATVRESLQFASIPLFQFAIFYNIDLEICPGQNMVITGPVFSNAGIWAGSEFTTFSQTVTAVGAAVNVTAGDPFALNYSPHNGGPTFTLSGQPTVKNNPLILPIGTNNNPASVRAILDPPPAAYANGTAAAYAGAGLLYLCNAADLIISNSPSGTNTSTPSGTNFFVYLQSPSAPYLTLVTPDYYKLKTGGTTNFVSTNLTARTDAITNVLYAGYTFLTNMLFYDWREGWNGGSGIGGKGKAVQAVQIDIGMFNTWVTNTATNGGSFYNSKNNTAKGHPVDSIYVYNAVGATTSTLPAVRVTNGKQLPSVSGFTVATPFPMYVLGNYNSQTPSGSSLGVNVTGNHAYPAALMADAITVLSTSWNDGTVAKNPTPGNTTVNAAMLEGIVQTDKTVSGDYSGGVENFMRLLENWNGTKTLTYNGSIVVMFPSQYATNHWNYGNYYTAPARNWAFDTNFRQQSLLPPLTPQSKAVIRGQWLAY